MPLPGRLVNFERACFPECAVSASQWPQKRLGDAEGFLGSACPAEGLGIDLNAKNLFYVQKSSAVFVCTHTQNLKRRVMPEYAKSSAVMAFSCSNMPAQWRAGD